MSSKHDAGRRLAGGPSRISSVPLAVILCSGLLSWALPVQAANKIWANALNGDWKVAGNWSGGMPTATDSATFNKAGAYTVNFSNVFQDLNDMFISAGTVTFERLVSPATLVINNATGGRDLTIGNATLNLGQSLAVNMTVGDDTIINSGGALNVRVGFLNTTKLFVNAGGTLSLVSGSITSSGFTQVNGSATVSAGNFASPDASIGSEFGSSGAVTITGSGTMTINGEIIVGLDGTGTLAVSSGADVLSELTIVGLSGMGTVTVSGAGSNWNQDQLIIGQNGAGTMLVQNGGSVHSDLTSIIGASAGGVGDVTVTGPGSKWTMRSLALTIGGAGMGTLTISDGGSVEVVGFNDPGLVSINSLSTLNIGAGGLAGTLNTGTLIETGTLINNGTLNFNHIDAIAQSTAISGSGSINKTGAGSTTLPNAAAFAGSFVSSGGELILQGSLNASLYAATPGGTLRFDGSTVNLSGASAIRASGGAVEYVAATVNGGVLRGDLPGTGTHTIVSSAGDTSFNNVTIQNSVGLIQNGDAKFTNVTNGGRLTSNEFLFFDGGVNATSGHIIVNQLLSTRDFTNNGQITVNAGGTLSHWLGNLASGGGSRTTVNAGGTITLLSGVELDLNGALLVNNGTINGTTNVNYGSLAKGTGTYGVVNVNTGGVYASGNSPGISTAAALSFDNTPVSSGAPTLAIELGGTTPGTQYDQVHVTGNLSLGGTLAVSLIDSFAPAAGQAFDILDWGSLNGTFATLQLPALSGSLAWNTAQLYTAGILSVGLLGDYNANGVVDAADYVVWRKGPGTTYTPNDYNVWQANFGQTAGSGAGAKVNAAVPEPANWALMLGTLCLLSWGTVGRRRIRGATPAYRLLPCPALLFRGFAGANGFSSGTITVNDPGSTWAAPRSFFIGNSGRLRETP